MYVKRTSYVSSDYDREGKERKVSGCKMALMRLILGSAFARQTVQNGRQPNQAETHKTQKGWRDLGGQATHCQPQHSTKEKRLKCNIQGCKYTTNGFRLFIRPETVIGTEELKNVVNVTSLSGAVSNASGEMDTNSGKGCRAVRTVTDSDCQAHL